MTWWIALYVYLITGLCCGIGWLVAVYRDHYRRVKTRKRGHPIPRVMDGKIWFVWLIFFLNIIPILNLVYLFFAVIRPWWSDRKITIVK